MTKVSGRQHSRARSCAQSLHDGRVCYLDDLHGDVLADHYGFANAAREYGACERSLRGGGRIISPPAAINETD
jgi:hypothetical protein